MVRSIGIMFRLPWRRSPRRLWLPATIPPPRPLTTFTRGSFDIENSRADEPIFAASDVGPGDGASGTVTVPPAASPPRNVQLTILRIRAAIWHRRLVLWAYCGPGTRSSPACASRGTVGRDREAGRSARCGGNSPSPAPRGLFSGFHPGCDALCARWVRSTQGPVSAVLVLRDRDVGPLVANGAVRLRHLQPGGGRGRLG